MQSESGAPGNNWSKALYRQFRDAMPYDAQRRCVRPAASGEWDLVAAAVLDWAMRDHVLRADQKVQALAFVQAGMFGRSSSYLEHRLSSYRPPIVPRPSPTEYQARATLRPPA